MFTAFFDKLSGFFDRRFIVTYWTPTMLGLLLALALLVVDVGVEAAAGWWDGRAGTQQLMFGLGTLFVGSILAYLLQAFAASLLELYEGVGAHRTQLGAILDGAEDYSQRTYNLPGDRRGAWWPRLLAVLPDDRRLRIDDGFAAVVALLNLCTVFLIFAFAGGAYAALAIHRPAIFALVYAGGLLLAWFCYRGALIRAVNFADLIEAAFDYHRHDILEALHVPLPDSLAEERVLWYRLSQLVYNNLFPWDETISERDSELPHPPFHYDHYRPRSSPPKPDELHLKGEINLRGTPTVYVRGQGGQ